MLAGISSLIAIAYAVGIYLCVIWQRTLSPNSLPIRFPLRISMPASPLARRDAIDFGVWTRNLKTGIQELSLSVCDLARLTF